MRPGCTLLLEAVQQAYMRDGTMRDSQGCSKPPEVTAGHPVGEADVVHALESKSDTKGF